MKLLPGSPQSKINIKDIFYYISLVQKHLRLMVLLLVTGLMLGLSYYVFSRPVFFASSIYDYKALPSPIDAEDVHRDSQYNRVIYQLLSRQLITRAARDAGFDVDYGELMQKHVKSFRVRLSEEYNLVVSVHAYNQKIAYELGPAIVKLYVKERAERRKRIRDLAIEKYRNEVEIVDEQVRKFHDKKFAFLDQQDETLLNIKFHNLQRVPSLLSAIKFRISMMEDLKKHLADEKLTKLEKIALIAAFETRGQIQLGRFGSSIAKSLMKEAKGKEAVGSMVPSSFISASNYASSADGATSDRGDSGMVVMPSMVSTMQPWAALESQYSLVDRKVEKAGQKYLPGHRIMRELNAQKKEIQEAIDVEYNIFLNRFNLEYANMLAQEKAYEGKLPAYTQVQRDQALLKQRERQFSNHENNFNQIYNNLYRYLQKAELSYDRERVMLNFDQYMDVPDYPVAPNKLKALLIGVALGLVLAIAVPFGIEYLDHTITSLETAERTLGIHGLGIVPIVADTSSRNVLLDRDHENYNVIDENFRNIRCNLTFKASEEKPPQVIMITSACPKEGKTFVSCNLGLSFSHIDEKVLVIDCDMRRGRLGQAFGVESRNGLIELLLDKVSLDDAVVPTGYANLFVLPVGEYESGYSDLLVSGKFDSLMEDLRKKYDRIIVDAPPVLGLSDTSAMQKHIDGIILVATSAQTDTKDISASIKRLVANGGMVYGMILNKLDLSVSSNYYQYYYYSRKYYEDYTDEQA